MSSFDVSRLLSATFLEQVEYLEETSSTNDVAIQRIAAGLIRSRTLILAEKQTAGRGRGSNRWWSAGGALTFSLVLQPEQMGISLERWPRVSLVAALAVCAALEECLDGKRAQIKWPNDIFCQGRKISGILAEAPAAKQTLPRNLVIGIGVNVNNSWAAAPAELKAVGTSLCDLTGRPHDPTDLLVTLLNELEQLLHQLALEDGRLAELWKERCYLTGRRVSVQVAGEEVSGLCVGIAHDGTLALETSTGVRRLTGGIVRSYE